MSEPDFYFFETKNSDGDVVSYILEDSLDYRDNHGVTIHDSVLGHGETKVIRTRIFKALFIKSSVTDGWMSDDFYVAIQHGLTNLLIPISKNQSRLPAGFNFIDAHKVM